jgi:hypothetical protein
MSPPEDDRTFEARPLERDASAVVHDAAAVVEDAAHVVESAAAVVQDAAEVVQKTASAVWPAAERRSKPRLFGRRHEARVEWKHIAIYVPIVILVAVIGAFALWSFFEKQSLQTEPLPLPKVMLITADPRSHFTAAWVRLLSDAEMQPTLVPLEKVEVLQGVVVLCDLPSIPPALAKDLRDFVARGGAVAVLGTPPSTPIGDVSMSADAGMSDNQIKFSEAVSPVLARLQPGYDFWVKPAQVAFLKESPRMVIDARWKTNARAVIMHMEKSGTRYIWLGLDPDALTEEDRQLMLLLRTAFRWVAGQPVSDGALGKNFTPQSREAAHAAGFSFSVDPLGNSRQFAVRMTNRGKASIQNPTVKVWLPPGVTEVALAGDPLMKRNVTLTGVPDEGACLISRPRLTPGEDRVMKLKVVGTRK